MNKKSSHSQELHAGHILDPKGSNSQNIDDPLGIDAVDHIEIFCGNAKQALFYYCHVFGFAAIAYRGPETGFREAATYLARQGSINLLLTSPLRSNHVINSKLSCHGDTVSAVSFTVKNCEAFFWEAIKRGALSAELPTEWSDENGTVRRAAINTYGEVVHCIVERNNYRGLFWPGFVPYTDLFPPIPESKTPGLLQVDHVVGNVELGAMNKWVAFYEKVLGFKQIIHFSEKDISTEYSALMSKVMTNGTGKIKFPINEPAQGKRKSQIEEYLDFHSGPGVQHIALLTQDIISTVTELRRRGMSFLRVPKTYYDEVPNRVGKIKEDLKKISELGILVDRDEDGYLLQLFTKPVQDRPTLFFEVIQREGSQGFGVGNFKALFEAIEREQSLRGNL